MPTNQQPTFQELDKIFGEAISGYPNGFVPLTSDPLGMQNVHTTTTGHTSNQKYPLWKSGVKQDHRTLEETFEKAMSQMKEADTWRKYLPLELRKNIEDYIELGDRIAATVLKYVHDNPDAIYNRPGPKDYRDKHHDIQRGEDVPF